MTDVFEIVPDDYPFAYFDMRAVHSIPNLFCATCGCRLEDWDRPFQKRKVRQPDFVAATYDRVVVTSARGRDFFLENASTPVRFHEFWPGVFTLKCLSRIEMDVERFPLPQLEDKCSVCGEWSINLKIRYNHIRRPEAVDPFGLYFSDQMWGSCPYKFPSLILGRKLAERARGRIVSRGMV